MLTINQCRDDLLSKLSITDSSTASALALQDVVIAMNAAMQVLQTAGEYYFTRQTLSVAFGAGTTFVALPQTLQTVIGPARWNNSIALRGLESRGEYDEFDRIFLGSTSYGVANGTPFAYFVEDLRVGNAGDIIQSNIYLCPKPAAPGTLWIDVIYDAPNYTPTDFSPGTAFLPVAQNYTESVYLPIARMFVTRSHLFSRPDIQAQLQTDFDAAMAHLIRVGGFPDPSHKDPLRKIDS